MKIRLSIERIVIDGTDLTRHEQAHLAETLERELVRLLRERADGGSTGRIPAVAPHSQVRSALGSRIARELLAALPPGTFGPPVPPPPHGRLRPSSSTPGGIR